MRAVFWLIPLFVASCTAKDGSAKPSSDSKSAPPAVSQESLVFADIAAAAGIDWIQRSGTAAQEYIVEVKSTGVALLDIEGDGLLDIFFTAGSTIDRFRAGERGFAAKLYRNLAGLRFEDVTEQAGIPQFGWACGAAAADVDGDGQDDLFVTCIGPDRLLMNRGGRFEDVGAISGIRSEGWNTGAAFADLDSDGDLDLYVAGYLDFDFASPPRHGGRWSCLWQGAPIACGPRGLPPSADTAYRNRGDGTFEDATDAWGFSKVQPRYGLVVLVADLAGDAGPDVYVANDAGPNYLFARRGAGLNAALSFEEVGLFAGCACDTDGVEQASMGVDAADLDGNGHLDLVVTNFEQEKNNVFLSDGRGHYFDQSDSTGMGAPSYTPLSWGVGIYDFDKDGHLDIYVVNGHVYPLAAAQSPPRYAQCDQFFRGADPIDGKPRWRECGAEVGLTAAKVGRGAAFGDLDNDGDVDVVVCHLNDVPGVYENRSPSGNKHLTLSLRQEGRNRQAIGARVEVRVGALVRIAEVRRQGSFQSSNDPRIHVGLGAAAPAGEVRVRWPDGSHEQFATPDGGGMLAIDKGRGTAIRAATDER